MTPNPCRTPGCRDKRGGVVPTVTIDDHNGGVTKVQCPRCKRWVIGDSKAKAVAEWNHYHPRFGGWPWLLAAAIVLAAFIGGAINGA